MSPFSRVLRDLRMRHGLRQGDFAAAIGYEQTYISALELGVKGPPTDEFVSSVLNALPLAESERAELLSAARASDRKIVLDHDTSESVFWMFSELREHLDALHPAQISTIRAVVAMRESLAEPPKKEIQRPRRRSKKEAAM